MCVITVVTYGDVRFDVCVVHDVDAFLDMTNSHTADEFQRQTAVIIHAACYAVSAFYSAPQS